MRRRHATFLAMLVLVSACDQSLVATPLPSVQSESPTQTSAASNGSSSEATATSRVPPTPDWESTHPRPTPTRVATPAPPIDPTNVWQVVEGFPPAGASLASVSLNGSSDGFIIVGSLAARTKDCPERIKAMLWEGGGGTWNAAPLDDASNAQAELLPSEWFGWPVIGSSGSPGCPGVGPVVWNPTDKGDWFRNPDSGLQPTDEVTDYVGLDWGRRVASGYIQTADGPEPHVWVGHNDILEVEWHDAASPPALTRSALGSLSAKEGTVIGFGRTSSTEAWYSTDAGESWAAGQFDPAYSFTSTDAAAADSGFYASGRACCALPTEIGGVVLHSGDGSSWTPAGSATVFPKPVETIAAWPDGVIALGEETYLSTDGSDWRLGPALPGYEPRDYQLHGAVVPFRLRAVAREMVVAITPTRAWYATIADLDPTRWPEKVIEPELPRVGGQYEYRLFTHCGPLNGSLQFGFRSWVPDLPSGAFPLSYDSYYEQGSLTFVSDDLLEFKGGGGDVVTYHPTEDPPARFPCA